MPTISGTSGSDYLVSPGGATIDSGAGDDVIVSGGRDVLTGGSGSDTFVFGVGATAASTITDWHSGDHLAFSVGATSSIAAILLGPNATYAQAQADALAQMSVGNLIVLEEYGTTVAVFVDSKFNRTIGDALVFPGHSDNEFLGGTFVGVPAAPLPAPPPPPPLPPPPPPPPPVAPPLPTGDLSGVVTASQLSGWIYDPYRQQIDMVSSDGMLRAWSIPDRQFELTQSLGGSPGPIDITPDGKFLLIGNEQSIVTSGPFAFEKTYADILTRVNLDTHAVEQFQFVPVSYEGGIGSLAIGANGVGLTTTYFLGSGWTSLRQFQASAAPITFSNLPVGNFNSLPANMGQSSYLIPSEDRRYILVEEANISDGAMHLFDSMTGQFIGSTDLYALGSAGFQSGGGDVSTAAGRVVDVLYNNVFVFDLNLHPVANLSLYTSTGGIVGGEFNEGGHQLFLWQGATQTVRVIDTLTWLQVGSLSVTTPVGSGYIGAAYGNMDVVEGGRMLLLDTGSGVELVDLAARLHVTINGGGADELVYGAIGDDTLNGGGGRDTVVGGGGHDQLSGGQGADLFVFAPGDSQIIQGKSDIILDWDSSDALSFGARAATAGTYVEGTAASFAEATSFANGRIASGASYVAVGVGQDVVVFADSRGDHGSAEDAVVLVGRGLNDVSFDNIVAYSPPAPPSPVSPSPPPPPPPPPPPSPLFLAGNPGDNTLTGGAGDDTISCTDGANYLTGGDGNDVIMGGQGFDRINGNVGNDTAHGGVGGDWVSGGKDNDALYGDTGGDIVNGNLGSDTCDGGLDNDSVRGGQGDDLILGGQGNDYLTGDLGGDTLSGGTGADAFRAFSGGGHDVITDFNAGEGDRVVLDPGTSYTATQVGADVVLDFGGGAQTVVRNVVLETLPEGWIVSG